MSPTPESVACVQSTEDVYTLFATKMISYQLTSGLRRRNILWELYGRVRQTDSDLFGAPFSSIGFQSGPTEDARSAVVSEYVHCCLGKPDRQMLRKDTGLLPLI